MLRVLTVLLSSLFIGGVVVAAQQSDDTKKPSGTKLVTLNGCIGSDLSAKGAYRFSESKDGTAYRLTGLDVHQYSGHRVEVSGTSSRRLHIVGGLYPSPNVAAQAGSIDPTQAAIAAQNPQAPNQPLPELRVKSVHPLPGACPQD